MVANTVSVTEERKTEEIHETPQTAKGTGSLAPASDDAQPLSVGSEPVEVAVSGNESSPSPAAVVDEQAPSSTSPISPETLSTSPSESRDSAKKDRQKVGSRFSFFGKKKKKSVSEAEDLKNVSGLDAGDVDSRRKHSSLGRKAKSPKSSDSVDGEADKRSSGGPFSFLSLKHSKAKPCSKVPGSESAPALDLDDEGQDDDVGERIVYELEVEGNVVAKVRAKSSSSSVDDAERPIGAGRHLVVVAIDFGTTFSGYAFSFVPDTSSTDGQSPTRDGPIHMMRRWEGGDPGVINQKTLTALLLTPEGQFQAFGFTARNLYHDLDPAEAQRWMYFDKFKMALHNNPVNFMIGIFIQPLTFSFNCLTVFHQLLRSLQLSLAAR